MHLIDYQTAVDMLTAILTTQTVPLVRVPRLEFGLIMKVLDASAYAIICPMANTREDAENLFHAGRCPLAGTRSFGPIRPAIYGGANYVENANDEIVLIAMIETEEALDNVKEIAVVVGQSIFGGYWELAQQFMAGSHGDGYTLSSVSIWISGTNWQISTTSSQPLGAGPHHVSHRLALTVQDFYLSWFGDTLFRLSAFPCHPRPPSFRNKRRANLMGENQPVTLQDADPPTGAPARRHGRPGVPLVRRIACPRFAARPASPHR